MATYRGIVSCCICIGAKDSASFAALDCGHVMHEVGRTWRHRACRPLSLHDLAYTAQHFAWARQRWQLQSHATHAIPQHKLQDKSTYPTHPHSGVRRGMDPHQAPRLLPLVPQAHQGPPPPHRPGVRARRGRRRGSRQPPAPARSRAVSAAGGGVASVLPVCAVAAAHS